VLVDAIAAAGLDVHILDTSGSSAAQLAAARGHVQVWPVVNMHPPTVPACSDSNPQHYSRTSLLLNLYRVCCHRLSP
jgi:hypothetical protein